MSERVRLTLTRKGDTARRRRALTKLLERLPLELVGLHELLKRVDGGLDVVYDKLVEVVVGVLAADAKDGCERRLVGLLSELLDVCERRAERRNDKASA